MWVGEDTQHTRGSQRGEGRGAAASSNSVTNRWPRRDCGHSRCLRPPRSRVLGREQVTAPRGDTAVGSGGGGRMTQLLPPSPAEAHGVPAQRSLTGRCWGACGLPGQGWGQLQRGGGQGAPPLPPLPVALPRPRPSVCPKEGQELAASCPAQFPPRPAPPGTLYLEPWPAPSLPPPRCSPSDPGIALLPAEILLSRPAVGLGCLGGRLSPPWASSHRGWGQGDPPCHGAVCCWVGLWGQMAFWGGWRVLPLLPRGVGEWGWVAPSHLLGLTQG